MSPTYSKTALLKSPTYSKTALLDTAKKALLKTVKEPYLQQNSPTKDAC
jgi:hypothetical protein